MIGIQIVTEQMMDDYTRRLFRRKIPTMIVTALVLLAGALVRLFAGC